MGKIAVITDSNSGITQKQAEQYGVVVVPMPFLIAGETYFEDVTLTHDAFFARLQEDVDISTSQPSPETVMEIWDKALETSEEVVYIPMSSGLSGSCQTAIMLAEDYDGKVAVVTGANTGLGQGMAVALAQAGAKVLGVARRSCEDTKNKIEADGGAFAEVIADLSDMASIDVVMKAAIDTYGRVDILVNNAGIIKRQDAIEFTEENWDSVCLLYTSPSPRD